MKFGSDPSSIGFRRGIVPTRRVCMAVLCALAIGFGAVEAPRAARADTVDRSLLVLLPSSDEVRPWVPDAPAQFAEGQELFALINGGAEIFLRHGFERVVAQTYSHVGGRHIQVEIYKMESADGATEVFLRRTGATERPLAIGNTGVQGDYYIVFRTGRFLVTVTAGDAQPDAQATVLRIARAIERRIPTRCP